MAQNNKRSIELHGHQTSLSIEAAFWAALHDIALKQGIGVYALIARIDERKPLQESLSSAVREFVLKHYQQG